MAKQITIIMNSYFRLIMLIMVLMACSSCYKKSIENPLYHSFIFKVIDSLGRDLDKDFKALIHYELESDNIKKQSVQNLLEYYEEQSSPKVDLLAKLNQEIDNMVLLNSKNLVTDNLTIYVNKDDIDRVIDEESFDGQVNISPIMFNEVGDMGCFYFAIQCGSNCGKGVIVYIVKEEQVWAIDSIIPVWS